jgi:hypothetical protein
MTEQSPLTLEMLVSAIKHHLPQRTVVKVEDRGVWIRHNFRVTLDGGETVHLKVDQAFPASEKEAFICQLLRANGLPAPQVLAVDTTGALLPTPFIIQQHVGGGRLGELLDRASTPDKLEIYRALGRFYNKLHSVHHAHSGWIQGAGEVLPFSPTERQYNEVILKIGQDAVQRGLLSARSHERLRQIWSDNLPWLDEHKPSLVAGALPWATYLIKVGDWQVSKIMDLSDVLYWDAAWDLTIIKYPPFRIAPALEQWRAFLAEYGAEPDERRLKVYLLMQRLEAALGNYLEPAAPEHERWKQHVWQTFDSLLAQVERL